MRIDNGSEAVHQRLDRLERQVSGRSRWTVLSMVLNMLLLGIVLSSCQNRLSGTVEARKIVLKDPANHTLAVLSADNKAKTSNGTTYYYPAIEFFGDKGDQAMSLSVGGMVWYGNQNTPTVGLGLSGLDIRGKDTQIWLEPSRFYFQTENGVMLLSPHDSGMNLTIRNTRGYEIGVVTDSDVASLYAASPTGEVEVNADKTGLHVARRLGRTTAKAPLWTEVAWGSSK